MKKILIALSVVSVLMWAISIIPLAKGGKVLYDTLIVENTITKHDTVIIKDTITKTITKLKEKLVIEEIAIEADTTLCVEQAVYGDEDYTAFVSGIMPKLDSIKIYKESFIYIDTTFVYRNNYITKKPKKWNFGIQGGYGITPNGLKPYIGVGVTLSIF